MNTPSKNDATSSQTVEYLIYFFTWITGNTFDFPPRF